MFKFKFKTAPDFWHSKTTWTSIAAACLSLFAARYPEFVTPELKESVTAVVVALWVAFYRDTKAKKNA